MEEASKRNMKEIWNNLHKAGYDQFSKDTWFWRYFYHLHLFTEDKIVLDIGCGNGNNEKWISKRVKKVYGVDISEEVIKKAKEKFKEANNVLFYVNDGKHLDFEENKFDLIFSFITFVHMPKEDAKIYFEECERVLKKEGLFLFQIAEWNIPYKEIRMRGGTKNIPCFFYKNLEEIKNLFKDTNFSIEETRHVLTPDSKYPKLNWWWVVLKNGRK